MFLAVLLPLESQTIRYYQSNSVGSRIQEIPPENRGEYDYVLAVSDDPREEETRLLEKGEEIKRTLRIRTAGRLVSETVVQDNQRRITEFRSDGRIDSVSLYREETFEELLRYRYVEGRLEKIESYSKGEQLQYVDNFLTTTEGRLIRTARSEPDKPSPVPERVSSYRFGSAGQISEYHRRGEAEYEYRYSPGGLPVERRTYRGGRLSELSFQHYRGRSLIEEILVYPEGDAGPPFKADSESYPHRREIRYNKSGEEVLNRLYEEGILVKEVVSAYDGQDKALLTEKRVRTPGLRERYVYRYNDDAEKSYDAYYRNGRLVKEREYADAGRVVERLYREGNLSLIVTYQNEQKEKVEIIRNGAVVRTDYFGTDREGRE